MRSPASYELPLCAQTDQSFFFPDKSDNSDAAIARSICALCMHKQECLDWAIATNEEFGIWGGASPRQRRRIKEKRKKSISRSR